MKKNNGFTLIELLAVILILGIIALIAIPTVNSILKESRTGAWKSTASQMTKAAENYFQLKQIKNQDYVVDFKTGKASNNKFFTDKGQTSAAGDAALNLGTSGNKDKVYSIMLESLSLKGDIPKFDEKPRMVDIEAEIVAIKENHKPIIIGKNGDMLKKIGISARKEIEELVGKKVNLHLFVKVRENWQDNLSTLRDFGYDKKGL